MEKYFQPYRGNPTEVWLFRDKSQNQEFLKKYQPIFEFRTTDDNRTEWRWRFKHFGWARRMRVWLSMSTKLAALLRLDEMVSLSNGRIEKSFWADDSNKIIIIFHSSRDETKWLPFPAEDEKRLIFVYSGIHETGDVRGIENDVNDVIIVRPAPPSVAMALKNEWGEIVIHKTTKFTISRESVISGQVFSDIQCRLMRPIECVTISVPELELSDVGFCKKNSQEPYRSRSMLNGCIHIPYANSKGTNAITII